MVKKICQHQLLCLQMMTFFQVKQKRESFKGSKVKTRGLNTSYIHTRL